MADERQYLYVISIISKTVMEWKNISLDVLRTSRVHQLDERNGETHEVDAGISASV